MFIEELSKDPAFFWGMALVIVFSICLHELAHGLAAVWLGDDTPINEGRMTLNPFVHMGLFSLICLLISGIAWGSMPVNERRLRGRYGVAIVAIAGPATNALLAALSLVGLGLWMRFDGRNTEDLPRMAQNGQYLLRLIGYANVLLLIFNLIPIPPLDGSNVMRSISRSYSGMWQRLMASPGGSMQLFLLVFIGAGWVIGPVAKNLTLEVIKGVSGWR
jgi:Zn-dependent protease